MSDIRMDYTNAPTPEAAIDSISRVQNPVKLDLTTGKYKKFAEPLRDAMFKDWAEANYSGRKDIMRSVGLPVGARLDSTGVNGYTPEQILNMLGNVKLWGGSKKSKPAPKVKPDPFALTVSDPSVQPAQSDSVLFQPDSEPSFFRSHKNGGKLKKIIF